MRGHTSRISAIFFTIGAAFLIDKLQVQYHLLTKFVQWGLSEIFSCDYASSFDKISLSSFFMITQI